MAQPLEGEPAVGREGGQGWGRAQSLPGETGRDRQPQETAAGQLSTQGLQGRGTWGCQVRRRGVFQVCLLLMA